MSMTREGYVWAADDGRLMMQRCPRCSRENWAPAVSSGVCSWCGERAHARHVTLRRGLVFRGADGEVRIVDLVPSPPFVQMAYVVPTNTGVVFTATLSDFDRWRATAELIAGSAELHLINSKPKWYFHDCTR